jgi:hypothetical protein
MPLSALLKHCVSLNLEFKGIENKVAFPVDVCYYI